MHAKRQPHLALLQSSQPLKVLVRESELEFVRKLQRLMLLQSGIFRMLCRNRHLLHRRKAVALPEIDDDFTIKILSAMLAAAVDTVGFAVSLIDWRLSMISAACKASFVVDAAR